MVCKTDHFETTAASLLESLTGLTTRSIESQAHGEHDYELLDRGIAVGGMEVTRSVDRQQVEAYDILMKRRHHIDAPKLRYGWLVYTGVGMNLRQLKNSLEPKLSVLEQRGITDFNSSIWSDPAPDIMEQLLKLKVLGGSVISRRLTKRISVSFPSEPAARIHPGLVHEAAMNEVGKADNMRKLRAIEGDQRHLFVMIDVLNYPAWKALIDGAPPPDILDLPSNVTHLWVAASTRRSLGWVVWKGAHNT